MRQTLGSFSYYRNHILNFASLAAPLYGCTSDSGLLINWTPELNEAWYKLLKSMEDTVKLTRPDYEEEFYVSSDASGIAIGGTLRQRDKETGELTKLISTFSQKLSPGQKAWETSQRELFAIYKSVMTFSYYLYARHFTIITDSRVCTLVLTAQKHNVKFEGLMSPAFRWIMYLSNFDYVIKHQSGQAASFLLNDQLSRLNIKSPNDKLIYIGKNSKKPLAFVQDRVSGKYDELREKNVVLKIKYRALPSREQLTNQIRLAQSESRRIKSLMEDIRNGVTNQYKVHNGVVYTAHDKLVVPPIGSKRLYIKYTLMARATTDY